MPKGSFLPEGFWYSTIAIFSITLIEIGIYSAIGSSYWSLHAGFVLFALILLLTFYKKNLDIRYLIPFCLFFIPFGPFGGALITVSLILYLIDHYITQPIGVLISSLFPKEKEETSEYIYERLLYHLEDTRSNRVPIPFKDIMHYGNYNQKRIAIEKMLRYFKPEFAPILKIGLNDPSSAIKVQTATAISFIDHKMFDRFSALKNSHLKDPEDPILLKTFAELGAYYSLSGILDEDRQSQIINETIPMIHTYLKQFPKERTLKLSLAKLYLIQNDRLKAEKLLNELLNTSFNSEAAYLLMDIHYELKDYEGVKELAQRALNENKSLENHEYIKNMALAWAGGEP
jgi:hypothetical protein